ncbi:MAG: DnaJ domain-containing protein [Myxococcota bacterium]
MRALPLAPAEAFVLALVDGATSEAEIASSTGLTPEAVSGTIARLVQLGAVVLETRVVPEKRAPRPVAPTSTSGQFAIGRVAEMVMRIEHPGAALYDESELNEAVDLDPARKRQILDLFYRLDSLNHYELLGVPTSADRRAIKARYHEIINVFHPDRYYGKNLGRFKSKLERVFQRVTDAHDTLTRNEARAEYDAYLNSGRSTEALERELNDEEAYARELQAVRARIEAEAQRSANTPVPGHVSSTPPGAPSIPPSAPVASRPSVVPSVPPMASSRPPMPRADADARRRALARKLGLSSPPPAPEMRSSPPPAVQENGTANSARERAATDLKRRYDQRMMDARRRQVHEYLSRAETSMSDQKVVEAVNALRIAVSLAPDDPLLRRRLEDLQTEANKQLADRYLEQGDYEEREKRWADAARSYARAVAGKPSARLHERLAFCLLAAQGDVKSAVEHARKAVLLAPNDTQIRTTLARAYLAAGMRESGIGELERAAALAPSDDTLKDYLRRARRGEI